MIQLLASFGLGIVVGTLSGAIMMALAATASHDDRSEERGPAYPEAEGTELGGRGGLRVVR